jgi:hypothetical protein
LSEKEKEDIKPAGGAPAGGVHSSPPGNHPPNEDYDNKSSYYLGIFAYIVTLSVIVLYLVVSLWPVSVSTEANQTITHWPTNETVTVFSKSFTLSGEVTILWIVMLMGAIGALVYISTALVTRVANKKFDSKWTLWYLVHPLLGSSMAVIFYALLRGGLVNLSVSTGGLNLYGVAAVSALVGLSSKEAAQKLKDLFNTLFEGKPSANQQYNLTMVSKGPGSTAPSSGSYDKGTKVTITAKPDSGHEFKSWTGTGAGSYTGPDPSHTITMNAAITETATFT